MKFGAREICDVVLKAKVDGQKVGNNVYKEGQPIVYFDSLKTTSIEQATTPVYAQGGKGNTKLISWEGEKTLTFVMEDALLSPISFAILSKANLQTGAKNKPLSLTVHMQGRFEIDAKATFSGISEENDYAGLNTLSSVTLKEVLEKAPISGEGKTKDIWVAIISGDDFSPMRKCTYNGGKLTIDTTGLEEGSELKYFDFTTIDTPSEKKKLIEKAVVFIDYYYENTDPDSTLITIEPETFEGNYYLEASTLFRTTNGIDLPAEFIIPNCKPQSAMTIALASTGDPSTFTFTMDVYPDYTKYDPTKKVLAAIQILDKTTEEDATNAGLGYTQF